MSNILLKSWKSWKKKINFFHSVLMNVNFAAIVPFIGTIISKANASNFSENYYWKHAIESVGHIYFVEKFNIVIECLWSNNSNCAFFNSFPKHYTLLLTILRVHFTSQRNLFQHQRNERNCTNISSSSYTNWEKQCSMSKFHQLPNQQFSQFSGYGINIFEEVWAGFVSKVDSFVNVSIQHFLLFCFLMRIFF